MTRIDTIATAHAHPAVKEGADADPLHRVLVVDDSLVQRRILSKLLGRWGYAVMEAGSGEDALALCRATPPDLILSDWMMPGMSGPELCEAVRALGHESYCYFILLTSRSDKTDVALGLDRGADDFLTKPVDMTELRARLVAGKRILAMHGVVTDRNRALAATLAKLEAAQGAIDRDLREARRLQQSLVPDRFLACEGADVSLLLRPAGHIGGDLVGVLPVGETELCLYGIDVAGHGIASALMTARLAGHFAGQTPDRNVALVTGARGAVTLRPPEDVCAILNRIVLADMGDSSTYFTLLVANVDLATGRVRMAQAGHPAPVVLRADGRVEFVGDGGLPVGLIAGATYGAAEVRLAPGDRLLIHSDGITEGADPAGRMLDDDGLIGILQRNAALRGPRLLDALIGDLVAHAGGNEFADDISAVLLERSDTVAQDR